MVTAETRDGEADRVATQPGSGGSRSRLWLDIAATLLVVAEFGWLVRGNAEVVRGGGEPWQTGDWLIDLAGGPVRRGPFGELVLHVAGSGPAALWWVFWTQTVLLAVVVAATVLLYWRSPRTVGWFMLVFSPAFLLFPFLGPEGAFRKELLGLAAFALLALLTRFRAHPALLVGVVLVFALGGSAHELTALMLPAFAYLLVWGHRQGMWSRAVTVVVLATLGVVAVASLAWAVRFPASQETTSAVCRSWLAAGLDGRLCSGSLRFLAQSVPDAVTLTRGMFPSYFSLLPLVVLSLLPMYVLRVPRRVWWLVAVSYVAFVPLFLLAIDYGRWIYVVTALVSLTCLATWPQESFASRQVPVWLGVAFVSMWSLPYAGPAAAGSLLVQVLSPIWEAVAGPPPPGTQIF